MDKGKSSAQLAMRTVRMLNYWIIIEYGTHDNGSVNFRLPIKTFYLRNIN